MNKNPLLGLETLFLDIGGVLLTNGWDHNIRRRAAEKFNLDYDEMNERHHLTFDIYVDGKLSLDGYLNRVVFYQERSFSREEFRVYMDAQSKFFPEMIDLMRRLKSQQGLEIAAVSNEGRELTDHRIQQFKLGTFIDFFVSSNGIVPGLIVLSSSATNWAHRTATSLACNITSFWRN